MHVQKISPEVFDFWIKIKKIKKCQIINKINIIIIINKKKMKIMKKVWK